MTLQVPDLWCPVPELTVETETVKKEEPPAPVVESVKEKSAEKLTPIEIPKDTKSDKSSVSGLHTPKKERKKIDFKLNQPKEYERKKNTGGLTAQGHAELKLVQPDDDDPLMIELDDVR